LKRLTSFITAKLYALKDGKKELVASLDQSKTSPESDAKQQGFRQTLKQQPK